MPRLRVLSKSSRRRLINIVSATAISSILFLGILFPTPCRAQSQNQTAAPAAPDYKYEVASIKPSKLTNTRWSPSADGFNVSGATLKWLLSAAFRVIGDYSLSGGPTWLNSDRYDVEAKMDPDAAEALNKLSNEDRAVVQQHMIQALLAERFGLVFHRETRDMAVYMLVVGKSGSKLHEAKPGDTYPNGIKLSNGPGGAGVMMMRGGPGGTFIVTAQGVPLSSFIPQLSGNSGRPVLDKTGLTGIYDFTLTYALDQNASASATSDSTGPSIFTAIQEQLGLKLEPGKGPVEVIVIDRAEKPSGN